MNINNLYFFDKFGESYNFEWDSTNSRWVGNEWIKPISVALFDCSNIFILEKLNNGSFVFPQLSPGESITLKWQTSENSSEFFLYNVVFDAATQLPYIAKVESQAFSYEEYPTFNPNNSPDILGSKLSVSATSTILTWRAVPNLQYGYTVYQGYNELIGNVVGSGSITVNNSMFNIGTAVSLTSNQQYRVVLTVTHLNSTVNAVYFDFVAGQSQVILGTPDPNYVTQPSELNSLSVLQFNVAFNPIEEKGYTRVLNAYYNTSSNQSIHFLQLSFYGEGEAEDERFRVWLGNFGIKFNREDALLLKDYNLSEGLPDWSMINQKRKELLVNKDQIFPYIGTYKGLVNFIDIMGYKQTIKVKEYWKNVNSQSENYNKFAMLDITDIINSDAVDDLDLVNMNSQIKASNQFKKTNMLALVYEFDELSGEFDDDGIPIVKRTTEFSVNEIFFKLNGLGKKIKREFLPVNVQIKDIIGEFLFFERYTFRYWYDRTDILDVQVNDAYDIVIKTPAETVAELEILDVKSLYKQGISGYPVISFNESESLPFENGQKYTDPSGFTTAIEKYYHDREQLLFSGLSNKPEWEYSDESSAEIGCPIILGIDNEAPTIGELDGVTINDTGKNKITVGGIQYLNYYEIEWTIEGITTVNPYRFSWRAPIVTLNELPHILPYIGNYRITSKLYDLYGGVSKRYKTITVVPQNPVVMGMMKLEDKFNYRIDNLNNAMIKDLQGSYVYNPKAMVFDNEHANGLRAVDIDRVFLDWATYSLNYGFGRSQYSIQILSEDNEWEDYFTSTHPEKKNWGTAQNITDLAPIAVPTINDYQNAQVGEMFHTRLSNFGWQSDFQNGFYMDQVSIVGGTSVLTIGQYAPYTIPTFTDFEDLIEQLNAATAPGVSDFIYSIVGSKIHANSKIQNKQMHQEWSLQ